VSFTASEVSTLWCRYKCAYYY